MVFFHGPKFPFTLFDRLIVALLKPYAKRRPLRLLFPKCLLPDHSPATSVVGSASWGACSFFFFFFWIQVSKWSFAAWSPQGRGGEGCVKWTAFPSEPGAHTSSFVRMQNNEGYFFYFPFSFFLFILRQFQTCCRNNTRHAETPFKSHQSSQWCPRWQRTKPGPWPPPAVSPECLCAMVPQSLLDFHGLAIFAEWRAAILLNVYWFEISWYFLMVRPRLCVFVQDTMSAMLCTSHYILPPVTWGWLLPFLRMSTVLVSYQCAMNPLDA